MRPDAIRFLPPQTVIAHPRRFGAASTPSRHCNSGLNKPPNRIIPGARSAVVSTKSFPSRRGCSPRGFDRRIRHAKRLHELHVEMRREFQRAVWDQSPRRRPNLRRQLLALAPALNECGNHAPQAAERFRNSRRFMLVRVGFAAFDLKPGAYQGSNGVHFEPEKATPAA